MDINKYLAKSIENAINFKGIKLEFSRNFNMDYFDLNKELENDNIRSSISFDYLDSHMYLYVISNMLKEQAITISFNENSNQIDINNLNKLIEEIEVYFELKNIKMKINEKFNMNYFELNEEIKNKNISIFINKDYSYNPICLSVFLNMLKENTITISFNQNAREKDINYLNKLSKNI